MRMLENNNEKFIKYFAKVGFFIITSSLNLNFKLKFYGKEQQLIFLSRAEFIYFKKFEGVNGDKILLVGLSGQTK
jgi:hypothetical protein